MTRHVLAWILVFAASLAGGPSAHAGPCTGAISRFETAMHRSAATRDVVPTAPQTIGAQLGCQPTPTSVARADKRAQAGFDAALARAKRLDARNDGACMQALDQAKQIFDAR
jgi:hypothetical protein